MYCAATATWVHQIEFRQMQIPMRNAFVEVPKKEFDYKCTEPFE
jgi:hypothetical protein